MIFILDEEKVLCKTIQECGWTLDFSVISLHAACLAASLLNDGAFNSLITKVYSIGRCCWS